MQSEIIYVELKSGYSHNGPAWIGRARYSKSGRTLFFDNKALQVGRGIQGNYFDLESGEEYWVSGVKKNQQDRHRFGSGPVNIDKEVVEEYLSLVEANSLNPKQYIVMTLNNAEEVRKRVNQGENRKLNY